MIEGDGTVTVTVDGQLFLAGPIGREIIGEVIGWIAEQHGGPIHLEVREPHGVGCTRIVSPPPTVQHSPAIRNPVVGAAATGAAPEPIELTGQGFFAGESIAVAVVLQEIRANRDGQACAVVDRIAAPGRVTDVILFGTTSGTLLLGGVR